MTKYKAHLRIFATLSLDFSSPVQFEITYGKDTFTGRIHIPIERGEFVHEEIFEKDVIFELDSNATQEDIRNKAEELSSYVEHNFKDAAIDSTCYNVVITNVITHISNIKQIN